MLPRNEFDPDGSLPIIMPEEPEKTALENLNIEVLQHTGRFLAEIPKGTDVDYREDRVICSRRVGDKVISVIGMGNPQNNPTTGSKTYNDFRVVED